MVRNPCKIYKFFIRVIFFMTHLVNRAKISHDVPRVAHEGEISHDVPRVAHEGEISHDVLVKMNQRVICHWNFGPEKFGPGRKFSLKILVRPDR